MNSPLKKARRLLALLTLMLATLFLVFVFFATQNALDVWAKLQTVSRPLFYTYISAIGIFIAASLWLAFRILKPRPTPTINHTQALDEHQLQAELAAADERGIDTRALHQELHNLSERKASGRVYVSLFGDISTGKSSIIKALLPDAQVDISARGGSTREITQYVWKSTAGDELVLTDLPGRNEAGGGLEEIIEQEARRSQLVIYVCDSDLNRSQLNDIKRLLEFNKPLILCMNKSDRLNAAEKQQIETRIHSHLTQLSDFTLVFIQSGGDEQVIRIQANGSEKTESRKRPPRVEALGQAIQDQIDQQLVQLNQLRDASVFVLVKQKLDQSTLAHRQAQAEKIVQSSTQKAIFGALASLSPGSDLIIQGMIGTAMVKDLCALYETSVKDIEIEQFFDFSQGQIRKTLPLLLAVAGNAMKAFPGIGTVTGGLTHAIAYGLIFDALGHAVHKTLQQRGALKPAPAAISFTEYLNQNMLSKTTNVAKLVFEQSRTKENKKL